MNLGSKNNNFGASWVIGKKMLKSNNNNLSLLKSIKHSVLVVIRHQLIFKWERTQNMIDIIIE